MPFNAMVSIYGTRVGLLAVVTNGPIKALGSSQETGGLVLSVLCCPSIMSSPEKQGFGRAHVQCSGARARPEGRWVLGRDLHFWAKKEHIYFTWLVSAAVTTPCAQRCSAQWSCGEAGRTSRINPIEEEETEAQRGRAPGQGSEDRRRAEPGFLG